MILTIALLLSFQLAGLLLVTLFGLPVPGPVMGMVLFLFALMTVNGLLEKTLPVVNAWNSLLTGIGPNNLSRTEVPHPAPAAEYTYGFTARLADCGFHHRFVHPRHGHDRPGNAMGGSTSARLEQKGEASCLIRFFLN